MTSDTDNATYLRGYRAGRKQGSDMTKGEFYDAAFLAALSGLMSRDTLRTAPETAKLAHEAALQAAHVRGEVRYQK